MSRSKLMAESQFFEEHRYEWLAAHPGEFVLVNGTVHSFHKDWTAGFNAGLAMYGVQPFLLQRIEPDPEDVTFELEYSITSSTGCQPTVTDGYPWYEPPSLVDYMISST